MLKREVDTQQTLYNGLLTSSNQAALVALWTTSSVRILDAAVPSSMPISPKPVPDVFGCAMASLVLGYALVWLREMSRRKKATLLFDAPGHTRLVLGVPELGVIPSALIEEGQQLTFPSSYAAYAPQNGNGNGHKAEAGMGQSKPIHCWPNPFARRWFHFSAPRRLATVRSTPLRAHILGKARLR